MTAYFNELLEKTGEYGVVFQVSHPIVFIVEKQRWLTVFIDRTNTL